MKLYSIDVKIYGTAYIKAETPEAAREAALRLKNLVLEVKGNGGEIAINGEQYGDELPEVSLSPAMSCYGPDDDTQPELCYEYDPPADDDEEE